MNGHEQRMAYVGEFVHQLDARNRVTVPSSWRVAGDDGNFYFAWPDPEGLAMKFLARVFADRSRYERAQRLGRFGQRFLLRDGFIERLPGPLSGWSTMRDAYPVAAETFRDWWRSRS